MANGTTIHVHPDLNGTGLTLAGDLFIGVPLHEEAMGRVYVSYQGSRIDGYASTTTWTVEVNDVSLAPVSIPGTEKSFYCDKGETMHVKVFASNPVSNGTISGIIQCVEMITDVTLELTSAGFTPVYDQELETATVPLAVPVSITVATGWGSHLTYRWTDDTNNILMYKSTSDVFVHAFNDPNSITLRLENAVDTWERRIRVITKEPVIVQSFEPKEMLMPGRPVKFALYLSKYGTTPCYKFDPGDGNLFYYGEGCDSNLTSLVEITVTGMVLSFEYSYRETGHYEFTVEGWNMVSREVRTVQLPVNSKPCNPPDITIQGVGKSSERPRIEYKSSVIMVTSFTIISCELTSQVEFIWWVRTGATMQLILLSDTSEITFPARFFETGRHEIVVQASMEGTFGMVDEDSLFFDIIESPLHVELAGGEARNVGWNKILTMDAWSFTNDPDVAPEVAQDDVVFTWHCQYATTAGTTVLGSTVHTSLGVDTLVTDDDSACFAGASWLNNTHRGMLSMNTQHLKLDAVYTITVEAVKAGRQGSDRQDIMIVTGDPPTVQIR